MTITWEQILAFLCEDQTMAITSLLFLAFFAAVALINYACPACCGRTSADRKLRLFLL